MIGFDDFEFASRSDVGVRRSHNQDAFAILPAKDSEQFASRGHVFVVADGMGAHAVGELASKIAADTIPHSYSKYIGEGTGNALNKSFIEANETIHSKGQQNPEFAGMGTTGSALVLRADGAWIGHVGDSRVYRVRNGVIEQLSFDHSLVWELARRQKVSPEEISGVPSNVIVRSLGPEPSVQVDVEGPHPIQPGDAYVLCSDGLSGPVPDKQIGAVLSALTPEDASRMLIHMANMQGGPDNITAVVIRVKPGKGRKSEVKEEPGPGLGAQVRELPWAPILLGVGIVLLLGAIYARSENWHELVIPAFALGGITLLAGLGLLAWQLLYEPKNASAPRKKRKLQVYKQVPCAIDADSNRQLADALPKLEQRVRELGVAWDEKSFKQKLDRVGRLEGRDDPLELYRERCQALLILMDALAQHRGKEESFKPLWEKK